MKDNISEDKHPELMKECFIIGVREFDSNILEERVWTPDGERPGLEYLKEVIQNYLFAAIIAIIALIMIVQQF